MAEREEKKERKWEENFGCLLALGNPKIEDEELETRVHQN